MIDILKKNFIVEESWFEKKKIVYLTHRRHLYAPWNWYTEIHFRDSQFKKRYICYAKPLWTPSDISVLYNCQSGLLVPSDFCVSEKSPLEMNEVYWVPAFSVMQNSHIQFNCQRNLRYIFFVDDVYLDRTEEDFSIDF